jgi:hypothetical protein
MPKKHKPPTTHPWYYRRPKPAPKPPVKKEAADV